MQRILTLCFCMSVAWGLSAQEMRFIDEIYEVGTVDLDTAYGQNISVLLGADNPELIDLEMDIYQPAGDGANATPRPIVCLFHTGNFLPQYVNRGAYGSRVDSANVEIIRRLVRRGFVAASVSYRQGWLPTSTNQEIRTASLLQAAYRGGQDAHTLARFLRRTVDEMGNPYNIDTSRIVFMGVGTGGYVVNTHAFLDRNDEIGLNPQFYDSMGDTLIQGAVLGNPQGTAPGTANNINHPGYSSDVAMTINVGGACGDPIWIEGQDNEPLYMAFHSFTDPFAPFYEGQVGVPVGGGNFLPVIIGARGGNGVLEILDDLGGQPELADANAIPIPDNFFSPLSDVLNQINAQYKMAMVQSPVPNDVMDTFQLGRDNLFPNVYPRAIAGPYNWFDEATMRFIVGQFPASLGLDPDEIIMGEEQTNPNWNDPDEARKNIDTMIAYMLPRLWYGLDLEMLVSAEDLVDASTIGLEVYPNPASEFVRIEVAEGYKIREIALIDMMGRVAGNWTGIDQNFFRLDRGAIPRGYYNVRLRMDEGIVTKRVLFE
ncbi:MAG: T9SS type A sorting domain-containing protein [Bacteroidota bacterium]